jgi:hypothetical protein
VKLNNPVDFAFSFQAGRKLVVRSEPPRLKKAEDDGAEQANREEEEYHYFFTE